MRHIIVLLLLVSCRPAEITPDFQPCADPIGYVFLDFLERLAIDTIHCFDLYHWDHGDFKVRRACSDDTIQTLILTNEFPDHILRLDKYKQIRVSKDSMHHFYRSDHDSIDFWDCRWYPQDRISISPYR